MKIARRLFPLLLVSTVLADIPPAVAGGGAKPAAEPADEPPIETQEALPPKPERYRYRIRTLPPAGENQPWLLIRQLQLAQDRIAAGTPGSLAAYRKLLAHASVTLLNQPSVVWQHLRNLDAASIFLLIGGDIRVGDAALAGNRLDPDAKLPLRAAIAFANRNFVEAHELMQRIDHVSLSPSAAPHFAMAKAMSASSSDLAATTRYLGEVRRLAPGTLLEEASIRRAIRIAGENHDLQQFKYLSRSYFLRFSRSLYFNDYLKNYIFALVRMPATAQDELLEEIRAFSKTLSLHQQTQIASYLARNATIKGYTALAYWASDTVLASPSISDRLTARMLLYKAASGIVDVETGAAATAALGEIDADLLSEKDRKLLEAVKALADRMRSEPMSMAELGDWLRVEQQIFPGDQPEPVLSEEEQEKLVQSNNIVRRYNRLENELGALIKKGT